MANAQRFRLEIKRELAESLDDLEIIVQRLALDGLSRIVQRTPVDTGRARGNWFVTIGTITAETTQQVDPTGAANIARGAQVIQSYEAAETWPSIFLQNNLPYIEMLENGGVAGGQGSSKQAPNGMVAVTLADLKAQLT